MKNYNQLHFFFQYIMSNTVYNVILWIYVSIMFVTVYKINKIK